MCQHWLLVEAVQRGVTSEERTHVTGYKHMNLLPFIGVGYTMSCRTSSPRPWGALEIVNRELLPPQNAATLISSGWPCRIVTEHGDCAVMLSNCFGPQAALAIWSAPCKAASSRKSPVNPVQYVPYTPKQRDSGLRCITIREYAVSIALGGLSRAMFQGLFLF